jgi:hypothetical protein
MQSSATPRQPIGRGPAYRPLVTFDRGYLILADHAIGGVERFDGLAEPWVIDRRDFASACIAGFGKAHGDFEEPWREAASSVECLAKGDHAGAQNHAGRLEHWLQNTGPGPASRDAVTAALKPLAKHAHLHPALARLKFNPNHDRLGRFAAASGSDAVTATPSASQESAGGSEHVLANPRSYEGHDPILDRRTNRAECVAFLTTALHAPNVALWKPGRPITRGADIPVGTAIATFVDGKYPRDDTGQHAAVYLGQNDQGIQVMDQWANLKTKPHVSEHTIYWNSTSPKRSDQPTAFSTILW